MSLQLTPCLFVQYIANILIRGFDVYIGATGGLGGGAMTPKYSARPTIIWHLKHSLYISYEMMY